MVRTIRRGYFGVFAVVAAMALLCVLAGSSVAADRDTTLVSVDSSGAEANDHSGLGWGDGDADISDDGRYVAFSSYATNLVDGDTNGFGTDIFVHDRTMGTTERVSVDSSGAEANGASSSPSISADGRYVAFDSDASNLVANDNNLARDVFVYDRTTGATQWVSQWQLCICTTAQESYSPSISPDGRYVAFTGNNNNGSEIFVRDRNYSGSPEWVSRPASGGFQYEYGANELPSISTNGRYVVFTSTHSNLVPQTQSESYPYYYDVFLRDRSTKTTELVSVSGCTTKANGDSFSSAISSDGRYVAFSSYATNLVAGDTNGFGDVFVHDRQLKDCIAPTTTANATVPNGTGGTSSYASGTPTSQNVTVSLNAQDNQDGSGTKEIRYSATGANPISEQTVSAANLPATFTIDAAGTTTISYLATDKVGNQESPKTLTVNIDRTPPKVNTEYPANSTKNVERSTNPWAKFSEKVAPASVSTSTFKLFKCSSTTSTICTTPVMGDTLVGETTAGLSADRLSASLNPYGTSSTLLASKTKYKAVITTGVTDEAGNALDQDPSVAGNQEKLWYFTTGSR